MIHMNLEDFRSIRHVLRFAGMGVMPAQEVVGRVADRVSAHLPMIPDVNGSIERMRAGILPSQEACDQAVRQLSNYFEGHGQADGEGLRMTQH